LRAVGSVRVCVSHVWLPLLVRAVGFILTTILRFFAIRSAKETRRLDTIFTHAIIPVLAIRFTVA
jgi:hypothetical protein